MGRDASISRQQTGYKKTVEGEKEGSRVEEQSERGKKEEKGEGNEPKDFSPR